MLKIKKNILSTVLAMVMLFGSVMPLYAQDLSFIDDTTVSQENEGFFPEEGENDDITMSVSDEEELISFSDPEILPETLPETETVPVQTVQDVIDNTQEVDESEIDLMAADSDLPHVMIRCRYKCV